MTIDSSFRLTLGDFHLAIDLACSPGEVVALLGPNGAGKSTVLRALAGLTAIDSGQITIGERVVDDPAHDVFVAAEERRVGMVFQDYALFPHLTVRENIEFGPRSRNQPVADLETWLDRFELTDIADRRPVNISGGQAQRCALARALVTEPEVLLLDEPLAALDAATRQDVRSQLRHYLHTFEHGAILVTHDPLDAMVLADTIVVLEDGRVSQRGPTAYVASQPLTPYVAALMGVNLVAGLAADGELSCDGGGVLRSSDTTVSGRALAIVRPEAVSLHAHQPEGSPRNVWEGTVLDVQSSLDRVVVTLSGPPDLTINVTHAAVAQLGITVGSRLWLSLKATDVRLYEAP